MATDTIPPKEREEWGKLLTGELKHAYKNYVLQTKTYQMQKDVASGKLTLQHAIDDLYSLCSKYSLAVQSDLRTIFISW